MLWACKSLEENGPSYIIVDPSTAAILQEDTSLSGVFPIQIDDYAPKFHFTVKCENPEFDTTFGTTAYVAAFCLLPNTWFRLKLSDGRSGYALVSERTTVLDSPEGSTIQNLSFWDETCLIRRQVQEESLSVKADLLKTPDAILCQPIVVGQQYTILGQSKDHMLLMTVGELAEDGKSIVCSFGDGSKGTFPIAGLFAVCNLWVQMLAAPIEPKTIFNRLCDDADENL